MGGRERQGRDADGAPVVSRRRAVRGWIHRRERRGGARCGAPGRRPQGADRDGVGRYGRALPQQGLQRGVAAREPAHRRRAAYRRWARGCQEQRRAAADSCDTRGIRPAGAQSDVDLQRVAAPRAGRRRRGGRHLGAGAHGARDRTAEDPRQRRAGRHGRTIPGRGQRVARRAADHAAVAHNAGGIGAGGAQRQGRRYRHALRLAASAGRYPLMRVTVLTGGATTERAVAFASASQIVAALRSRKHEVRVVDLAGGLLDEGAERELLGGAVGLSPPTVDALAERERRMLSEGLAELDAVRNAEVLFLAVHGGALEGGTLQAVLDVVAVPYTGSGPLASALAMDKDLSKRLFRAAGVPVPAWFMTPPPVAPDDVTTALGWPVIVKPSRMGSSVGMTLVKNAKGLDAAVDLARGYDREVMVEQFIAGRVVTVGILGDVPLPVGEIIPQHELFDYECKYTPGMSEEGFPAKLDPKPARQLQELALTAHRALKLGGYSRVDFRLSAEGDIFCLEANTLPGMTRTSLLPQAARAAGIEFPELCERICRLAGNPGSGRGGITS